MTVITTITGSGSSFTTSASNATFVSVGTSTMTGANFEIRLTGSNDVLTNSGHFNGVTLTGAGELVTNLSGGYLGPAEVAPGSGLIFQVGAANETVFNSGTIAGSGAKALGVDMNNTGFISNATTGTILGGAYIYGSSATANQATVVNAGKIVGNPLGGTYYGGGIYLVNGGTVTNLATGTISTPGSTASHNYGIKIGHAGATSASGTVTNAGTISGGTSGLAVWFSAVNGNRLIDDAGAVFNGNVNGGTNSSILELATGTGTGTLSGLGTNFYNFGTLQFDAGAHWSVTANTSIAGTTLTGFNSGDTIDVTGFTATNHSTLVGGLGTVLTNASGTKVTLFSETSLGGGFNVTTGAFGTDVTTICFCRGTMIDTPDGEVPVEKLAVGDLVRTLGGSRPVTWIGKGKVLATRGHRSAATPVIVRKGALADGVPNRDLYVTKAHSLYVDSVLIPVEFLVNHKMILWDDRAKEVEIYHVELDSHDVLFANGAPAESYRDDGNRWLFENANEGWDLPPQEPFAPVLTGGAIVDAAWRRLLDRAGPRDLPPLTDDPDVHLMVDGQRVDPVLRQGSTVVFRLARCPARVHVASREGVPTELGVARDPRSLGVAVRRIVARGDASAVAISANDDRLMDGFHGYEPMDDLRWTDGYGGLPAALFAPFGAEEIEIELTVGASTLYPDFGERVDSAAA